MRTKLTILVDRASCLLLWVAPGVVTSRRWRRTRREATDPLHRNGAWSDRIEGRFQMQSLFGLVGVITLVILPVAGQGQTGGPKAVPASKIVKESIPTQTPDGHSDLQGIWSFATLTPLERPSELAGKATLTDKEVAEFARKTLERNNKDQRSGGSDADVARAYNDAWWDFGNKASNQTSLIVDPPDGKLPALTPAGQKRAATYTASMTGIPAGPEDRPLWERCILGFNSGPPMLPSAYNNNVQIFQTRETVAILNEMVHSVRIVPMDGRPHGALRQWLGDSRGRWEGKTLVIDTINFTNHGTGTAGFRVPTDENFHLTERFTRKAADTLLYEFTVDDSSVWTKPWTAVVPMTKAAGPIYEYACHEGNYGMVGILSGARADEDAAKHPGDKINQ